MLSVHAIYEDGKVTLLEQLPEPSPGCSARIVRGATPAGDLDESDAVA